MTKNNIFTEDVAIPEIVLQKADSAFLTIRTERSHLMTDMEHKKLPIKNTRKSAGYLTKRFVAAAACAAVMITAGAFTNTFQNFFGSAKTETEDAMLTALDQLDQMFTLQIKAAGAEDGSFVSLEEGRPIPIATGNSTSWVFGANDEEGDIVDYCIRLPQISCEGEQIKDITYSINQGAFQVVQPENETSIIVDGLPYSGTLNTGSIGGDYDDENDGKPSRPFEMKLYQSITLDYEKQSDDYTWINICNALPNSEEIISLIWNETRNEETINSGIQKMLDGTVITCTVNYTDNTSQSVDITVGSCVMTRREAGESLEQGIDPKVLEEKTSVITFELQ